MADERIREILQKRKTLKGQITMLKNAYDAKKDNLTLRLEKVTELFDGFFDLNDELSLLDPTTDPTAEFSEIEDRYYEVAALITKHTSESVHSETIRSGPGTSRSINDGNQLHVKLPVAEIPKFDGSIENWITFKNSFIAIIDSHEGLNDTSKFIYLKSSLLGNALERVAIFHPSAENYHSAWKVLCDTYDLKNVLKTKHLSALISIPKIERASCQRLQKIASEMQQHIGILKSLDVNICPEMQYQLLFDKLPHDIVSKWEDKNPLSNDEFPTFSALVQFVNEAAFRLARNEADSVTRRSGNSLKRDNKSNWQSANKFRKGNFGARSFVTNTVAKGCPVCNIPHFIYQCEKFRGLSLADRWAMIRRLRLCRNCLRKHAGECTLSHCKLCPAKHHTLLHNRGDTPIVSNNAPVNNQSA